jgi:hypothetical protein
MAKPNTTPELDTDLIENLTEEELALKLLELAEGKCAKKEGTDPDEKKDDGEDDEEDDLDSKADDGDEDKDGVLLNEKKKKKSKFKGTWMESLNLDEDTDITEATFTHDVTVDPDDKEATAKYVAKHKALGVTTTVKKAPNGWSEASHTGPKNVLKKMAVKHYGNEAKDMAGHLFEGTDVDDPTQVKKPEPDSKAAGDAKSIKEKELAKAGCDNATENTKVEDAPELAEGAKEIQMKVNDTGTMKKSGQLAKVVVLKTGSSRYEVQEVSADGNPKGLPFKVNKLKITPSLLANLDFTEELNAIVSDEENLSEGFREKSAIIFEAALSSRLRDEKQILAEQYQTTLQEETAQILTDLSAKIDSYLTYAVEAWVGDNKVAIDESLRTEIAESLITSLKSVFVEHYIEIPESKRDLFTELEKKNAELKESADEIEKANATLAGQVQTLLRDKILTEASVGLADTQAAKLVELVEDVEFVDEDTFSKKVATLKGSFFAARKVNTPSATEKTGVKTIVEGVEDYNPEDPDMARYAAALKRANNR